MNSGGYLGLWGVSTQMQIVSYQVRYFRLVIVNIAQDFLIAYLLRINVGLK
jgi:hypothetical protein